jgi:hypothetical protein
MAQEAEASLKKKNRRGWSAAPLVSPWPIRATDVLEIQPDDTSILEQTGWAFVYRIADIATNHYLFFGSCDCRLSALGIHIIQL